MKTNLEKAKQFAMRTLEMSIDDFSDDDELEGAKYEDIVSIVFLYLSSVYASGATFILSDSRVLPDADLFLEKIRQIVFEQITTHAADKKGVARRCKPVSKK